MPHALVHIGPPKTGSTHIQEFFSSNDDKFQEHGWNYPFLFGLECRPSQQIGNRTGNSIFLESKLGLKRKNGDELSKVLKYHSCTGNVDGNRSCLFAKNDMDTLHNATAANSDARCKGLRGTARVHAVSDDGFYQAVTSWWKKEFSRIAKQAPTGSGNVLLSDECFAAGARGGFMDAKAAFLGPALTSAGFTRRTALAMYRTPVVAMARSLYNQVHSQGHRADFLLAFDVEPMEFRRQLYQYVRMQRDMYQQIVQEWSKAGFDVVMIDLAGAASHWLDEADVVLCACFKTAGNPVPFELVSRLRNWTPEQGIPHSFGRLRWQQSAGPLGRKRLRRMRDRKIRTGWRA